MNWKIVVIGVGIFYIGLFIGIILHKWMASRRIRSGTIFITINPDKTLFSLELDDDPELLKDLDEVIFKVEASEPDRE